MATTGLGPGSETIGRFVTVAAPTGLFPRVLSGMQMKRGRRPMPGRCRVNVGDPDALQIGDAVNYRSSIPSLKGICSVLNRRQPQLVVILAIARRMAVRHAATRTGCTSAKCPILIDEPTEGLAPHIVARVVEVISDIRRQGTAVVLNVVGHGQVAYCGNARRTQGKRRHPPALDRSRLISDRSSGTVIGVIPFMPSLIFGTGFFSILTQRCQ